MMKALTAYWRSKQPYEQAILAALAGAIVIVALWLGVLAPLYGFRAEARAEYQDAVAYLAGVERGAAEALELRQAGAAAREPIAASELRVQASARAQAMGLVVSRVQPEQDTVTLWMDEADPALLYRWLSEMQRDLGASVRRVTLRANEGGASLRATVTLGGAPT